MPNNAQNKRRLVSTVSLRIIVVAVAAISLIGGFSIYRDYTFLDEVLHRDLVKFEAEKRQLLEERARQAKAYVDFARGLLDQRLRSELRVEVDHALTIVDHLVNRFAASTDRETLAGLVRESLRSHRWQNGQAYFFILDLDGVIQLQPPAPEIEGTNILADPNAAGHTAAQAVVQLAKSAGEGFVEYEWPNPAANGASQKKLGFVRLFKPLGWIIGTSEYLSDFESGLKEDVLVRLGAISYDDGGYVFIGQWDGVALGKRLKAQGRNMWDVEDATGVKFVQKLIAAARAGGGVVEYVLPDLEGNVPQRKISYVVGIPEWEWYLGTGTFLGEIEKEIADRRTQGMAVIYQQAAYHVAILCVALGIFVWVSRWTAVRIESDYSRFADFFKGAATSDTPIATEPLAFAEFEELAHAANRMITERVEVGEKLRESEELYRMAFLTSPDAINLNRLSDGVYVDVNASFFEATGFTREEIIGRSSLDINIWADPADRERLVAGLKEHGQVINLEAQFRRKDGSLITGLMSARVVNIRGEPHVLSMTRGIDQLKQVEDALRESREKYRLLVENQTDLIVKVDLEGRFLYVSPSYCELFGKTEDELLGQTFMPLVHEDDREPTAKAMEALFVPPHVVYLEQRAYTAKGWRWLSWQDTAILDPAGKVKEIIGAGRDIHDRKMADLAFAESESKFRRAIENMPLIGVALDMEGRIVFANDHALDLTGWTADEILGRDWFDLFIPDDQGREVREFFQRALESGELGGDTRHENEIIAKDGSRILVSWFNVLTKNAVGKAVGIIGMGIDVTERTRAQRTLEAEKRFIATVLENLSDGVAVCDADGKVTLFNRVLREFHGFEADEGQALFDDLRSRAKLLSVHDHIEIPYDQLPLFRALRGETIRGFEMIIASKGRGHHIVSVNAEAMHDAAGATTGAVAIVRDITEHKRTEEQLRHAQKMEAVGHLTGGIAHDFNNLLQVILSNLQIAQEKAKADNDLAVWLDGARRAGWRGAELTQKLLSFSRKQTLYPKVVDPNALIAGMHDLLCRTLSEDIEIVTDLPDDVPAILIDPGGLENAILNLAVNARAAMPGGGRLTIQCRIRLLDEDLAIEADTLPAGTYVEIAIGDTGCGMPPDVLDRAFEPFFTTKDVGEGSGLGLSMVYGFARQSGGNVTIASKVGVGTTVTFLLPAARMATRPADGRDGDDEAHAGSGTVLVVEDDPDVRAITVAMFGILGYQVLEAADGEEALKVLKADGSIELLFSDVVMPKGLSGIDLARAATRLSPTLQVILTSGYPEIELRKSGLAEEEFRLLRKPYTQQELTALLNAVMGRS